MRCSIHLLLSLHLFRQKDLKRNTWHQSVILITAHQFRMDSAIINQCDHQQQMFTTTVDQSTKSSLTLRHFKWKTKQTNSIPLELVSPYWLIAKVVLSTARRACSAIRLSKTRIGQETLKNQSMRIFLSSQRKNYSASQPGQIIYLQDQITISLDERVF